MARRRAEREQFLAQVPVGVMSFSHRDQGRYCVSIWYACEQGGELWAATSAHARAVVTAKTARRMSFCVHDDTRPYRYVSVEGPVSSVDPLYTLSVLGTMARRYLGEEKTSSYVQACWRDMRFGHPVKISIPLERWCSADLAERD